MKVRRGIWLWRNKSNSVNLFIILLWFTQKIKHYPFVDFLWICWIFINLKEKTSTLSIERVLPWGFDIFSEKIDCINTLLLLINNITKIRIALRWPYVFIRLLTLTNKEIFSIVEGGEGPKCYEILMGDNVMNFL